MTEVVACTEREEWDNYVIEQGGHPLQLWEWGMVKEAHQWKAARLLVQKEGRLIGLAQVLFRPLPGPLKALAYIPRGPAGDSKCRGEVLEALASYVKNTHGAVAVTIEPDWEDMPKVGEWRESKNTVLIPRTLILDLTLSEDDLMAKMTKKTRQYIRKSEKEVTIRQVKQRTEVEDCMTIYKQTAQRAGFALHDDQYYYDVFEKMGEYSPVFAAYSEGKIVAFLWLAISGETAFELYGGMNDEGQQLRANYTLKWQTIKTMKKWGINRYDMNGLLNDGVSTFKQGFADHENVLVGTYDLPLSPLYILWDKGLPLAKKLVRKIKPSR